MIDEVENSGLLIDTVNSYFDYSAIVVRLLRLCTQESSDRLCKESMVENSQGNGRVTTTAPRSLPTL
jgi:hypothetical protein